VCVASVAEDLGAMAGERDRLEHPLGHRIVVPEDLADSQSAGTLLSRCGCGHAARLRAPHSRVRLRRNRIDVVADSDSRDARPHGSHVGKSVGTFTARVIVSKDPHLQAFYDAGGGTRTPDTRIMIPLL
jgi:hypothetical protein